MTQTREITETRKLKHVFSEHELLQLAEKLSQKLQDADQKELERKEITSQFKAEADSIQADISKVAHKVRAKFEIRDVECKVTFNHPTSGIKRVVRLDTDEIVGDFEMKLDEKQDLLDLPDTEEAIIGKATGKHTKFHILKAFNLFWDIKRISIAELQSRLQFDHYQAMSIINELCTIKLIKYDGASYLFCVKGEEQGHEFINKAFEDIEDEGDDES